MTVTNTICGFCKESLANTVSRPIGTALKHTKTSMAGQNITHLNCPHQFHIPCIERVADIIDKLPADSNNPTEFKQRTQSICKLCFSSETHFLNQLSPKARQISRQSLPTPSRIFQPLTTCGTNSAPALLQRSSSSSSIPQEPFNYMSQGPSTPKNLSPIKNMQRRIGQEGMREMEQLIAEAVQTSLQESPPKTTPQPLTTDLITPITPRSPQHISTAPSIANAMGQSLLRMGIGTVIAGIYDTVTGKVIESLPRTILKGTGLTITFEIAGLAYRNIFHRPQTVEEFLRKEQKTALRVAAYALTTAVLALL